MITSFLFVLLGLQAPSTQQIEQQLQQQRQQIEQLQQQTQALAAEVSQTQQLLIRELKPDCSAEARWEGSSSGEPVPLTSTDPFRATLFSIVSMPEDSCLPAEIRITASFYQGNNLVCSGSLSLLQSMPVQNTVLEFRPFELELFAKWRDRTTWEQSNFHRLICFDYEGLEVRDPALRARTLKVTGTVFGKRGGLATAQLQFAILAQPPATPQPRVPRLFED
jgi:hypothetical protein